MNIAKHLTSKRRVLPELRQWHVLALLWLQVLSYPLVSNYLEGRGIQWQGVIEDWQRYVPFFVLFLFHHFWAIPRFLLPRRAVGYLVATALLLGAFVVGQYLSDRMPGPADGPSRHALQERPRQPAPSTADKTHFPPPPKPDGRPHGDDAAEDGKRGGGPVSCRPDVAPRGQSGDAGGPDDRPCGRQMQPPRVDPHFLIMDFVFAVLMLGCNAAVVLLFQVKKAKDRAERLERTNMQHELKYLKAQFSPHFLMNTLNNIHAMIEVAPEQAQDMVIRLSKLLRYALYEGAAQAVPLSMELAFISTYVHLRRQGYSEKKLKINLSLPTEVSDDLMVPPLLFVVFIENAFKHGVSYRRASFIDIKVGISGRNIAFVCENSLPPATDSMADRGGIGLENVRKRLDLLYGHTYRLDIMSTPTAYQVTLNLPAYDRNHQMPGD